MHFGTLNQEDKACSMWSNSATLVECNVRSMIYRESESTLFLLLPSFMPPKKNAEAARRNPLRHISRPSIGDAASAAEANSKRYREIFSAGGNKKRGILSTYLPGF